MDENRVAVLGPSEDEIRETLLEQLAKAHGAESRAADIVAAECLIDAYRYAPGLGWLQWDGRRWDDDPTAAEQVVETVRRFIDTKERDYRAKQAEADATLNALRDTISGRLTEDERKLEKPAEIIKALASHTTADETKALEEAEDAYKEAKRQADIWLNLLSRAKIRSLADLCRAQEGILTRTSDLDNHPDLLNCHNCVVDLRTGTTQPHHPDLLITKLAGGEYHKGATFPAWNKALEAVHPDVLGWFQERIGQALSGYRPPDDSLVVSAGGGENGKSAVMEAILRASGSYGDVIDHKVLISQPGQHSTEKMDLRGLRLAYMDETPEEGRLDTQSLKGTVGVAKIKARHMRQNTVTFDATHSMLINTNFLPLVDTTDHGTWRRLFAMPWPYRFRKPWEEMENENDRKGDLTLKGTLESHPDVPAAILAWVVEGAAKHFARTEPAQPPAAVQEATRKWRSASDVGYQFATEHLVAAKDHFISSEEMFTAFSEFLGGEGKRPWSKQTLNTRLPESLRAAGIIPERTPTDKSRIAARHVQSWPATPTPQPGDWKMAGPVRTTIAAGKTVRVWMGVRFRTEAEVGQALHEAV